MNSQINGKHEALSEAALETVTGGTTFLLKPATFLTASTIFQPSFVLGGGSLTSMAVPKPKPGHI